MTKARNIADLLDANGIVDNAKITLDANEIPNLDASKIVSGDISAARLSLATETKPVVSSVSPSVITNDAQDIVITGTDFTAIPRVDIINTATGIWYSVNTVTHNSATQLTVNVTLAVDAGTYRIRVENPDGLAGLSAANFLTVSDAPTWSTSAGSLGTFAGNLNGAVATVSASGDGITYSETTNVLTNASLANCSLNSSTGAITTTDFDGSSTSARTHTFTIRATDAQGQTSDREFTLTSDYTYSATYLIVAGGGKAGNTIGGGGGAGGLLTGTTTLSAGIAFTATVGAGQTNHDSPYKGGNSSLAGSSITTLTAIGGGQGGHHGAGADGFDGGSGGGAGANGSDGTTKPGGSATAGQGNVGGDSSNDDFGAGGGGASAVGSDGGPGNGGAGLSNSITGSAVTYAGGGGGGHRSSSGSAGSGGSGGGGNGGNYPSNYGQAGTANLGGGGGGPNGNGGSGVVILSVPTAKYSGTTTGSPTISISGSNTIIKFTATGTYTG